MGYYHNYYVKSSYRYYCTDPLHIIEANKHQFIERKVVNIWIKAMVVSPTSATNWPPLLLVLL